MNRDHTHASQDTAPTCCELKRFAYPPRTDARLERYTPKSNARHRIAGTNCSENAFSCPGFWGVPGWKDGTRVTFLRRAAPQQQAPMTGTWLTRARDDAVGASLCACVCVVLDLQRDASSVIFDATLCAAPACVRAHTRVRCARHLCVCVCTHACGARPELQRLVSDTTLARAAWGSLLSAGCRVQASLSPQPLLQHRVRRRSFFTDASQRTRRSCCLALVCVRASLLVLLRPDVSVRASAAGRGGRGRVPSGCAHRQGAQTPNLDPVRSRRHPILI